MTNYSDGWLKAADRILSKCEHVFATLAIVMIAAMALIIGYSALTRYFFSWPTAWSLEISEYIMLYITFFSAAWILRNNKHVRLTILSDRFGNRLRLLTEVIIGVLIVCASFALFWFGWKSTLDSYIRNVIIMNILKLPKYLVLMAIPLGSSVLVLRSLLQLIESLKAFFGSTSNQMRPTELPQETTYRKV